jgi:hypothetical protein
MAGDLEAWPEECGYPGVHPVRGQFRAPDLRCSGDRDHLRLPGIGRLLVDSIFARDYAVVQTVVFFAALVIVVVNLLVDLTYAWLDPRIRVAR